MSWKTLIIASLIASLSFGAGAYIRMHRISASDFNSDAVALNPDPALPPQEDAPEEITIKGRINVLLIGEDNVEASRRSDTVAFIAVDIDNRNVRVLSLPRDTRVAIPGHGNQKLNHAFAFGHETLLRETVQNFLGTPIHYYVKIDYDNFPKLVDLVGGVDILVGKAMKYRDRHQGLVIDIPAGKHHMDGEMALKYVRFRHDALGDIGRMRRQQQFLKAIIHKMYDPANMLRFASLAQNITDTLDTDMRPSMTLQLCLFVKQLEKEKDKIFFKMLPGQPAMIDNLSYWVSDVRDAAPFLNATTEQLVSMDKDARMAMYNAPASRAPDIMAVTTAMDYESENEANTARGTGDQPSGVRTAEAASPTPEDVMSIVMSIPEAVAVLNGTGRTGMSQKVAEHLQRMGVDVVQTGNAKHFDYRSTNVIYPERASAATLQSAQLLAKLCGVSSALTRKNALADYPSLIVGHDYERLLKRLENSYVSDGN